MFDKNLGDQHPAALISDDDDGRNEEEDRLGETSKRTAAKTTTQSSVAPWFHGYHLSQEERERICRNANIRVAKLLTAREVRDNQRWTANPNNDGGVVRLVSGTVPILKDGRVLLISSRKDNGWSLPKGGWELDESLEEGAIRETFEEAGVLGLLGPFIIGSFLVESGKKKRKTMASAVSSSSSSSSSSLSNYSNHGKVTFCDMNELVPFATSTDSSTSPVPSHTHTCMTFFPMYIQQIADVWPENTRRRKAFSIDGTLALRHLQAVFCGS
jgi:diphosphoinositol-polyphosphate diphosphatase